MSDRYEEFIDKIKKSITQSERIEIIFKFIMKLMMALDEKENPGFINYLLKMQNKLIGNISETEKKKYIRNFIGFYKKYDDYIDYVINKYDIEREKMDYAMNNNTSYINEEDKLREFGDRIDGISNLESKIVYVLKLMDDIVFAIDPSYPDELVVFDEIKSLKKLLSMSDGWDAEIIMSQFISLHWNKHEAIDRALNRDEKDIVLSNKL